MELTLTYFYSTVATNPDSRLVADGTRIAQLQQLIATHVELKLFHESAYALYIRKTVSARHELSHTKLVTLDRVTIAVTADSLK